MKRLSLIILAIVVVLLAGLSFAADEVMLNGQTFTVTANDQLYTLTFYQGPFGPGESGDAVLSELNGLDYTFFYTFDNPVCEIDALTFLLLKNKLKHLPAGIPEDSLTFTLETSGGDE